MLFYTKYNTNDFVNSVEYYNEGGAFRQVKTFKNYHFININELEASSNNVYLVNYNMFEDIKQNQNKYEIENLEEQFNIKEFEGYVVLESK